MPTGGSCPRGSRALRVASADRRTGRNASVGSDFGLEAILAVVAGWILIGVAGFFALQRLWFVARLLLPAGGLMGVVLLGLRSQAWRFHGESLELPIGAAGAAVSRA